MSNLINMHTILIAAPKWYETRENGFLCNTSEPSHVEGQANAILKFIYLNCAVQIFWYGLVMKFSVSWLTCYISEYNLCGSTIIQYFQETIFPQYETAHVLIIVLYTVFSGTDLLRTVPT